MKFVLSLICLLMLCLVADAGDRKGKGHGAYAYACACANCPANEPSQPAATTKPTEVPVGNCANGTCSAPTINYIATESGSCSSGNCSAPARYGRRGR